MINRTYAEQQDAHMKRVLPAKEYNAWKRALKEIDFTRRGPGTGFMESDAR
jgi:hypothetical protein